jgi:methionyl-tRNA formyltransferase
MRLLFLTNNPATQPLADWLARTESVRVTGEPLTEADAAGADLVISYGYRHIIRPNVLVRRRMVNLHIAYLPFNRGADPNVWAQLDGTPSGVTIHEIDAGVDTGPILAQRLVPVSSDDTLADSYARLQVEVQSLFRQHWEAIRTNRLTPIPQVGEGTHHYAREFAAVRPELMGEEGWGIRVGVLKARWGAMQRYTPVAGKGV